jgi:hypothetical protein
VRKRKGREKSFTEKIENRKKFIKAVNVNAIDVKADELDLNSIFEHKQQNWK